MKHFITLCVSSLLTISICYFYFSQPHSSNNSVEEETSVNHKSGKKESIKEAIEYLNQRRLNDVTGKVEIEDYLFAFKEVAQHAAARKRGSSNVQWIELGPDNIGGRTRSIIVDKFNNKNVYAGAVSGGLYFSNNRGLSWTRVPLLDENCSVEEALVIGSITQASNGDIYVGTGEFVGTSYPGNGIYRSVDGGLTFCQIPSTSASFPNQSNDWSYVNKIGVDPTNTDRIYASTRGGLQVSSDWGATWKRATGTYPGHSYDVEIGTDGTSIHAVIGLQYWRSTDSGLTWEKRNGKDGFPNGGFNRLVMALAPTDDRYVYAYASTNNGLYGIYQSIDGGDNWSNIGPGGSGSFNPPGNQGWYDLEIAVMPHYPQRVFIGGQMSIWSWSPTTGWMRISGYGNSYVHADHHVITFDPVDPNIMYIGCDGGIYRSVNALEEYPDFRAINKNFNATQFYNMAASEATGEVIGGTQDNGTPYISFTGNTFMSSTQNITGGDGFGCEISRLNPNVFFASVYYGRVRRSTNKGKGMSGFFDTNIDADGNSRPDDDASFYTTLALWEGVDDTLIEKRINGDIAYRDSIATSYSFIFDTTLVLGDTIIGLDTFTVIKDTLISIDTTTTIQSIEVPYIVMDTVIDSSSTSASRLFLATYGAIWMANNAVNSPNPVWYRVANIASGGSATAMDYSKDGNYVYAATGSTLYRISGLRDATYGYYKNCTLQSQTVVDNNGDTTLVGYVDCDFVPTPLGITVKSIYSAPGTITDIAVDRSNNDHIAISVGNYGTSNKVHVSNNATAASPTFASIQGNLPKIPVYSILIDQNNSSRYYVGTEFGFYVRNGTLWDQENTGMHQVPTLDIRQQKHPENLMASNGKDSLILFIGTYGRGLFTSGFDPSTFVGGTEVPEEMVSENSIVKIYPNPIKDEATLRVQLDQRTDIEVGIYDIQGKLVYSNLFANKNIGTNIFRLNTLKLQTGSYFVRVKMGIDIEVRKIVVIK